MVSDAPDRPISDPLTSDHNKISPVIEQFRFNKIALFRCSVD